MTPTTRLWAIRLIGSISVVLFFWTIIFLAIYPLVSPFPFVFLIALAFTTSIIAHIALRLAPVRPVTRENTDPT